MQAQIGKPGVTIGQRAKAFEDQNVIAARAILEDVDRYGGESAGIVIWARMTLRHTQNQGVR